MGSVPWVEELIRDGPSGWGVSQTTRTRWLVLFTRIHFDVARMSCISFQSGSTVNCYKLAQEAGQKSETTGDFERQNNCIWFVCQFISQAGEVQMSVSHSTAPHRTAQTQRLTRGKRAVRLRLSKSIATKAGAGRLCWRATSESPRRAMRPEHDAF